MRGCLERKAALTIFMGIMVKDFDMERVNG